MPQFTLTVLDTSGIQEYLFGANNLRQNVGASYLADSATRLWVQQTLDQIVGKAAHNVLDFDDIEHPFDETKTIQTEGVQAEVIYAGGGNTAILFKDHARAKIFTTHLTRKLIIEAPDLKLLVAHQRFDWTTEALGSEKDGKTGVVQSVMDQLQRLKQRQPPAQPLRGLGVTVDCVFTARPVVGYDSQERPVSAESWAKQKAAKPADKRLERFLEKSVDREQYDFPVRFEDIGGSHEDSSYIAVVHADGNGMGKRVKAILEAHPHASQNADYVKAIRAFSLSMQKAAHKALNATVAHFVQQICGTNEADRNQHLVYKICNQSGNAIELQNDEQNGKPYLPFRPIVYGGDDVTFVCEGRLGLQLATYYLHQITEERLSDGEKAYGRAGVAITHAHYPFALAYELAESLCASAKSAIQRWKDEPQQREKGITAVDWHFAINGMNEELKETRARDYMGAPGTLLMRPLRLTEPSLDWRSWQQFEAILDEFQSRWLDQRNKLIGLREPLRQGRKMVAHYRQFYALDELPRIGEDRNAAIGGWLGDRCAYFDAIEALDFYGFLPPLTLQKNESEAR